MERKSKKGGVISGHDIDDENFPGVRFAVDEIFHDQWIKGEDYMVVNKK